MSSLSGAPGNDFDEVASPQTWDVVVVGAGPAGALAAYLLAKRSVRTLLIEKSEFPRPKVCGGCLSRPALDLLEFVGMGDVWDHLHGATIDRLRIHCQTKVAEVKLPFSRAVTRQAFDAILVERAQAAGAEFWPATKATVLPTVPHRMEAAPRRIRIQSQAAPAAPIRARLVLAADGLGHPSLKQLAGFTTQVARNPLVGLGTTFDRSTVPNVAGAISMAVGRYGYVGMVGVEHAQTNVAAAVDARALRDHGHAATIESILREAGCSAIPGGTAAWRGTRPLNCRARHVAETRLLLLGDSTGYVEPFTGEGIAWALASAAAVIPFALRGLHCWNPAIAMEWERYQTQVKRQQQRLCRTLTQLLRKPLITSSLVGLLSAWPALSTPLIHRLTSHQRAKEMVH